MQRLCPHSHVEELRRQCAALEQQIRELGRDLAESGSANPYSKELDGSANQYQIDLLIRQLSRLNADIASCQVVDDGEYHDRLNEQFGFRRRGCRFGPDNLPTQ